MIEQRIGALRFVLHARPLCAVCGTDESSGDRWYERADGGLVCREHATGGLGRVDHMASFIEDAMGMTKQEEDAAIDRIYNAADSCSPDDLRGPILEEIRRAIAVEQQRATAEDARTFASFVNETATAMEQMRAALARIQQRGADLRPLLQELVDVVYVADATDDAVNLGLWVSSDFAPRAKAALNS